MNPSTYRVVADTLVAKAVRIDLLWTTVDVGGLLLVLCTMMFVCWLALVIKTAQTDTQIEELREAVKRLEGK